jgi:hypothetical protein
VSDKISEALMAHKVELAGAIILNPVAANTLFLPVKISRDSAGRQKPSFGALMNLKNEIMVHGLSVEFLLVDLNAKSIEDGVRASLITAYSDIVRNAFVSVVGAVYHIWIDNKKPISTEDSDKLDGLIERYLSTLDLYRHKIHIMSEEYLATNTEFLAILRKCSPADRSLLASELSKRGFAVPSDDWMNRKFDALRKAGLVVRLADGSYALTAEALHRLGTRKDRHSPDVARLLVLARGNR